MSDSFDDDDVPGYPKPHAEIPGSQAIPAGKISPQRLRSTYVGPLLQAFQQVIRPRPNRLGKLRKLFSGSRGESDHCPIMTYYDKKVEWAGNPQVSKVPKSLPLHR